MNYDASTPRKKTGTLKNEPRSSCGGDRQAWKLRLVPNLYERGFSAKDVRDLFRPIGWIMELPPPFQDEFWQDVETFQKETRMPFISTPERVGHRRGLREGIEVALKIRFGEEGLKLMPEIRNVHEEEKLQEILKALETATSPEEVRRLW
jgi:hypothetical protein